MIETYKNDRFSFITSRGVILSSVSLGVNSRNPAEWVKKKKEERGVKLEEGYKRDHHDVN